MENAVVMITSGDTSSQRNQGKESKLERRKLRLTLDVFGRLRALQSLEEHKEHLFDVGRQNRSTDTVNQPILTETQVMTLTAPLHHRPRDQCWVYVI